MIVIGEKINATLAEIKLIVQEKDSQRLVRIAREQAGAGADYLDVNVATGVGSAADEVRSMVWAVETIQAAVQTPLCLDSADPGVLEAGLEARDGRASLVNSTDAKEKRLREIVPLAQRYASPLVALLMDESGIPPRVEGRIAAGRKIAAACEEVGLSLEEVFFDPLVLPVSTDIKQGLVTLETISALKKEFPGAKTVMGLSNVSYGLLERARLNRAFLTMAVYAGLDAVIGDPLDHEFVKAVRTAEVLVGKDRHCRRYTRTFRRKT